MSLGELRDVKSGIASEFLSNPAFCRSENWPPVAGLDTEYLLRVLVVYVRS